jgi:hypothetical protein
MGIPGAHIQNKIDQGRDNIERVLALNNYREWLSLNKREKKSLPWIDQLVIEYKDLSVTQFTGSLLVGACSKINHSSWLAGTDLSSTQGDSTWLTSRRALLGVSTEHYKQIRTYVLWLAAGGRKPTVRQKRVSIPRETKIRELPKWQVLPLPQIKST